jgi:glycosyltransferase involved in cell wall biosynthesis
MPHRRANMLERQPSASASPERSPMLRVAHLLPNMVTGGRERIVADLCAHATALGIEPHLVCYDPGAEGRRIATVGVAEHPLDRRRPDFVKALGALIAAEGIDVLHCQGHVAAALAAPLAGTVRTVATLHIALGSGWRWAPAIAHGLRAAAKVTAVSADLARRYRLLAGHPIDVILPGVDLDRFAALPGPRPPRPFTIGIAARLHPVKRHRDALAAARLLAGHGFPVRLVLAGQGPIEADLRRQSAGLDIHFDGDVDDMRPWFRGLDAFLLPSAHEGTPLALLEACASGLPCIATDVGGIRATFAGATVLVPPGRPRAIADAILSLASDPNSSAALGRDAAVLAGRHSAVIMAEAYARDCYGLRCID